MLEVDDAPLETLHIYFERGQPPRYSLLPIVLSMIALSLVVALVIAASAHAPYQQPVTRMVLRVPAVPLATKTFTAEAPIIPTGVKTYPATTAHGVLTITNGSIIAQILPAGFTTVSKSGISVATDKAVFIPAGSANGYGYASVSAHALIRGSRGNFARLAINQVIGASVYIRNLRAFSGGRGAYARTFATAQDTHAALLRAQGMLFSKVSGLHFPCAENHRAAAHNVSVTWRCQFISYRLPAFYHVATVKMSGKDLLISVWFTPRPVRYWVK